MAIGPGLLAIAQGLTQGALANREQSRADARQAKLDQEAEQARQLNQAAVMARLLSTPGVVTRPAGTDAPMPLPFDNVDLASLTGLGDTAANPAPFARLRAIAQQAQNVAQRAQSGRAVDIAKVATNQGPLQLSYDPAFSPDRLEAEQARRTREAERMKQRSAFDYLHAAAPDLYPAYTEGVDYEKARQSYASETIKDRQLRERQREHDTRVASRTGTSQPKPPKAPTVTEIAAYVDTVPAMESANKLASAAYSAWLNSLSPMDRGRLSNATLYRQFLARAESRLAREQKGSGDPVQQMIAHRLEVRRLMRDEGLSEADAEARLAGGPSDTRTPSGTSGHALAAPDARMPVTQAEYDAIVGMQGADYADKHFVVRGG